LGKIQPNLDLLEALAYLMLSFSRVLPCYRQLCCLEIFFMRLHTGSEHYWHCKQYLVLWTQWHCC